MTIHIAKEETRFRHMGYIFRLATRDLFNAPSHRHDSTYHGLCYISRVALAGTINSSVSVILSGSVIEDSKTRISRPRVLPCWSVGYKIWNYIK